MKKKIIGASGIIAHRSADLPTPIPGPIRWEDLCHHIATEKRHRTHAVSLYNAAGQLRFGKKLYFMKFHLRTKREVSATCVEPRFSNVKRMMKFVSIFKSHHKVLRYRPSQRSPSKTGWSHKHERDEVLSSSFIVGVRTEAE